MTERTLAPLDQESARTALDELFTLAHKYNSSDAYLELMRFVGRFRFYSPFNAMLIYAQMPGAHFVCTVPRWRRDYHRDIKTGAQPIVILQPMGPILFVFDVGETAPLPNARPLSIPVEEPFQVRNGKIGGQLALTIKNAKRDGVRIRTAAGRHGHAPAAARQVGHEAVASGPIRFWPVLPYVPIILGLKIGPRAGEAAAPTLARPGQWPQGPR